MEERLYLTSMIQAYQTIGGEQILTNVPYLSTLPINQCSWSLTTDNSGDVSGIYQHCMVFVTTTIENHAILENDSKITRVNVPLTEEIKHKSFTELASLI